CNTIADTDTSPHQLTAVTSDQPFLFGNDPAAVGQPPYQAIPVGAGSADKTWILKCNPPAQ
ncbi:MAG TPA: hypothetical protein VFG83_11265, partial [Kofleriaceae bacterium]|nr:hypothetical protein [Kofleriaceae bacterium]